MNKIIDEDWIESWSSYYYLLDNNSFESRERFIWKYKHEPTFWLKASSHSYAKPITEKEALKLIQDHQKFKNFK